MRLIDEDGTQLGVVSTRDALARASARGVDLVEIAPQANPPVCRVMDYGKYRYDQEKKTKQQKKNASATKVKEIKFHANVDVHDFQTKLRHATDFIKAGHRVKCSLFFRGREGAHQELGFDVMNRVLEEMKDLAQAESPPKLLGKSIIMLLTPKPSARSGH